MIKKLNEDTSLKFKNISPEEKAKKGILGRLYGPVASFAAPTRNGRKYGQGLWEKLFSSDLIKERFANGGIFGELCHPDYEEVDMEKVAVVMPEPPVKDDNGQLIAYVDIIDTPCGKIAYQLAKYGYKFGISSRGTGDIIEGEEGEEVDPDTYQLNAFDLVEIPAVESARLSFVESLDTKKKYGKTLKQRLTEELDKASVEDEKIMNDALKDLGIDLKDNDLKEKLVEPTEEEIQPILDKFDELGLEVEGRGKTWTGNIHFQLRKELDHNVESADIEPIFDELCELGTDDMPTVCNVGVHRDGPNIVSASLDILKKHVPDDVDEQFYLNSDKVEDAKTSLRYNVDPDKLVKDLLSSLSQDEVEELCRKYGITTDVYGKGKLGVEESLQNTDGWGDEVRDALEPTFEELEDLMYEIRNARRGSVAGFGDTVEELVNRLDKLSMQLSNDASYLESDEDRLDESKTSEKVVKKLEALENIADSITELTDGYEINTKSLEDAKEMVESIDKAIESIKKLKDEFAKFKVNESVEEKDGSDIEVEEEKVGDTEDLTDQLKEALTRSAKLEKDNLSLQEQLSVSNAKEKKLIEQLNKYRKATASLSESSKKATKLEEQLKDVSEELGRKERLLYSNSERIRKLDKSGKRMLESIEKSENETETLNGQIKVLKEQLNDKSVQLDKVTNVAKKYQMALKESKESYVKSQAKAYGISEDSLRAKLTESYSLKDVDSACKELSEIKMNMSKLPFRINEDVRLRFKPSEKESIEGIGKFIEDDDTISDSLRNMVNL